MIQYICFSWSNVIRIIMKHKFMMFLMTALTVLSLFMIGVTVSQNNRVAESAEKYDIAYGNKTYYFMHEALDDLDYYSYLDDDNNDDYIKLLSLENLLYDEDEVTFVSLVSQSVEVYDTEIQDIFLYSYESGNADESIYEFDGSTCYTTKAVQVSESFFDEFDITTEDGKVFSAEDFIFEKGKSIPVFLGSAYKDFFKKGDIISCRYLSEDVALEVLGFISENSFFCEQSSDDFISCERYIVMPSMHTETSSPSYTDKIMLLQNFNGIFISDKGYEAISDIFDELLDRTNLAKFSFNIINPSSTSTVNDLIESYSAMTSEVSNQFKIILIILCCFTIISLCVTICGFIREQHYKYGVYLLCGASYKKVSGEILRLIGVIIFGSALIAAGLTYLTGNASFLGTAANWGLAAVIWILTASVTLIYLKRIDVNDIIGGKE